MAVRDLVRRLNNRVDPTGHGAHIEVIRASGLFDLAFYASQAGRSFGIDEGIRHYLEEGHRSGLSPNRLFDAGAYLADHRDVAAAGMPPFLHFVAHGVYEGRRARVPDDYVAQIGEIGAEALAGRRIVHQALATGWTRDMASRWADRPVCVYASSLGNFFFRDIADRIAAALRADGVRVYRLDQNSQRPDDTAVDFVVAPHEFFLLGGGRSWHGRLRPETSVMFNTEQPGNHWYFLALGFGGSEATVVDLSPQSAVLLHQAGRIRSGYLPLGWVNGVPDLVTHHVRTTPGRGMDVLTPLERSADTPWGERPIDILFLGTLTPRRSDALGRLAPTLARYRCFIHAPTGRGRPLTGGKSDFGRDESLLLARRSKVILNIHRDDLPYFEWHRVITTGVEHGAVVLTEPSFALPGVVPGRHFLTADVAEMGDFLDRILDTPFGEQFASDVAIAARTELPAEFDLRAELRALSFLREVGFRGHP